MTAYYNENDPYAAQWLRNLIVAGHIAPGEVDERDVRDVKPYELRGYTQCHFFAGIGGWSLALRLADWPDHREVWTGSCPCQPFSAAGAERGFADERHLWPFWHHLIAECRPPSVFGEQVARATQWLRLVRSDLEEVDYAVGCMPIEAASAGAEHFRDRLWFVAYANRPGLEGVHAPRGGICLQPVASALPHIYGETNPGVLLRANAVSRKLAKPPAYREAIRGYGNAIDPQVAAEFIRAAS